MSDDLQMSSNEKSISSSGGTGAAGPACRATPTQHIKEAIGHYPISAMLDHYAVRSNLRPRDIAAQAALDHEIPRYAFCSAAFMAYLDICELDARDALLKLANAPTHRKSGFHKRMWVRSILPRQVPPSLGRAQIRRETASGVCAIIVRRRDFRYEEMSGGWARLTLRKMTVPETACQGYRRASRRLSEVVGCVGSRFYGANDPVVLSIRNTSGYSEAVEITVALRLRAIRL